MFEQIKDAPASGANNFVEAAQNGGDNSPKSKKKILAIAAALLGLCLLAFLFWLVFSYVKKGGQSEIPKESAVASSSDPSRLGGFNLETNADNDNGGESQAQSSEIEYLAFSNFYQAPDLSGQEFSFADYSLPINIKVDVNNYYDISRKLDLSAGLDALNNSGFALIDNPWVKEAPDFYGLASLLEDKQVPLFISADFISYYYQNILKSVFKEIEEGVFYESLWDINKSLYEKSRIRYESRLAEIGSSNDRILEGERLEAAFFAVSLELLKPQASQVDLENKFNAGKFSLKEQQQFSFTVPSYLTDDVLRELALIRASKEKAKSPVLLYDRDYKVFAVPAEYKNNARLQNFYLAAAWLNSVFPLNYRDESCRECLLDKDDWRINFTAAALISQDFSRDQELKNEWARVYKVISFFKGLKDTWNYVNYRDALQQMFGDDQDIASLFAETNEQAEENMENLRQLLLKRDNLPMQGGADIKTMAGFKAAGLQFLADSYWPNDFIFGSLRYPQVGVYQGGDKPGADNVTACSTQKKWQRCQGSSQDILSLVYPDWRGLVFLENGNYANYVESLEALRPLAAAAMDNNLNNYWSSLSVWRAYLNSPDRYLPAYLNSEAWRRQMTKSAVGAWTDMQLPLDKLNLRSQENKASGLSAVTGTGDDYWVEPNLEFFDRLLAHNNMLLGMFSALDIDARSSLAVNNLREAGRRLGALRAIALKQAQGEDHNSDDTQLIRDFAKAYVLEQAGDKTLSWRNASLGANIKESLNAPKLLIIVHPKAGKTVFAVGPVFNHQESR